jgi:hypothetical protein
LKGRRSGAGGLQRLSLSFLAGFDAQFHELFGGFIDAPIPIPVERG